MALHFHFRVPNEPSARYFNLLLSSQPMSSEDFIKLLSKENTDLHRQLQDLEYWIQLKEEELDELRKAAASIASLYSRIDENLIELEHMQNLIGKQQQEAMGAKRREDALETEMIQSVETEKAYYELKEEYESTLAMLDDMNRELASTPALVKELADLRDKLAEAESQIELLNLDNYYLKEELEQWRNRKQFLSED